MVFRDFYNRTLNTCAATNEELPFPVHRMYFKKGDIITAYGEVEKAIYFLNSGIVELTVESRLSEKVIDFFFDQQMFNVLDSFITQIPSDVQIRALEDSEMEMVLRDDLCTAYIDSIEANKICRLLLEEAYLKRSRREKDLLTKTAEERYLELFKKHRQYISNIPVNKLAKYLGIHPESLSRIRGKVNS